MQSVLVLGGGSDIAMAIVRELVARRTRRVVLAGRHPEAMEAGAAELRAAGADVDVMTFDATAVATHAEFIESAFADSAFAAGDVDLVIVAFGVLGDQDRDERDAAAAVDVLTANFTGAASVGVLAAERLRAQGHGTIVLLSSVAGERVRRANFVYGSAKAGVDAFYLGLGEALRGSGARVLVVRPGFVHTKMTEGLPSAPLAVTPDRVAADTLAGLAKGADLVWSPGAMRYVMSVLRHVPRPIFRRLPI